MPHVRNEVVGLAGSPRDVAKTFTYNQLVMSQSSIYSQQAQASSAGPPHKHQFCASDRRFIGHISFPLAYLLLSILVKDCVMSPCVIYPYIYCFYSQSFPLLFPLKTVRICPHWFSGWLWWISAPLRGVLCPGWIIEAPPRRRRRWPRCDRGDDAAWDQILIPTALKPLGRTILVGHCMIVRNCGSAWNRGLDSLWEISQEY